MIVPQATYWYNFSPIALHQYPPCDPKADAHDLHKAFKGLGTDEKTVIAILAHRSKEQLYAINAEYKAQSSSHHDLDHALKHEISGHFLALSLAVITPTFLFKRDTLWWAVKGIGTCEKALIDVLTQSTMWEIQEFLKDEKLREAILSDVSGDLKVAIEEIFKAKRPEYGTIPDELAIDVADQFYRAGEGKIGTDERKYTEILSSYSHEALKKISFFYKQKHKHGLRHAIKKETSFYYKDMLYGLLTHKYKYFAHRLHEAIAGAGTDERLLIYVFATLDRAELKYTAEVYEKKYKKTLQAAIEGDTSANFRSLLLAFLI